MSPIYLKPAAVAEYAGRRLTTLHSRLLRSVRRSRPLPLAYWLIARSIIGSVFHHLDPLLPSYASLRSTGASLQSPELQALLRDDELGTWAVDRQAAGLLWERIQRDRPRVVIECGAGVSSMIFAKYAELQLPTAVDLPAVFSLEQSLPVKQAIERRLETVGLLDYIQVLYTPTCDQGKYQLDTDLLWNMLGSAKADWIFIDGPAGPDGCRIWTLPLIAQFCRPGARWFLDDAFRDGELQILRAWSCLPGIVVEGIYPVGKGLATGVIHPPAGAI